MLPGHSSHYPFTLDNWKYTLDSSLSSTQANHNGSHQFLAHSGERDEKACDLVICHPQCHGRGGWIRLCLFIEMRYVDIKRQLSLRGLKGAI